MKKNIIELNNSGNKLFTFIKIINTTNYNNYYILKKIETEINKYEIDVEYVINEIGNYETGIKAIIYDSKFNYLFNYFNLHLYFNNNNKNQFNKFIDNLIPKITNSNIYYNCVYDLINNIIIILNKNTYNLFLYLNNPTLFSYAILPFISKDKSNQNLIFNNISISSITNLHFTLNNTNELNTLQNNIENLKNKLLEYFDNYQNIYFEIFELNLKDYKKNTKNKSCWIKNLGLNIIENCSLFFNDKLIDSIPKQYFNVYYQVYNKNNIKNKLNKIIGNNSALNEPNIHSKGELILYVKIPFYFSKNNYFLPNYKLNNTDIKIKFKISPLSKLIIIDNNTRYINEPFININLISDNIYFENNNFNLNYQLIEQLTYIFSKNINKSNNVINIPIVSKNSIKNIIIVFEKFKNIFNNINNFYKFNDENPITNISLHLNNYKIILDVTSEIVTLNYLKNDNYTFNLGINLINFNIYDKIQNVTGNLNLYNLNNVILKVTLNKDILNEDENGYIQVYFENYNVLKYMSGMANLLF